MSADPEVAIVGGGVVGASLLFHLAERGVDAALFERDQLASGSTSRAAGGVRHVFSHPTTIEAGKRNVAFYRDFESEVGRALDLDETGYLYLVRSPEEREEWERYSSVLGEHGVETRFLSPDETAGLVPGLDASRIDCSLYAPACVHLDPYAATDGFVAAAREEGATVHTNTAVRDIDASGGAVDALVTDDGTVEPAHVVDAAGAWAPRIASMVGLSLPVDLFARRIAVTEPAAEGPGPLVVDRESRCYFRAERSGSMLVCDLDGDVRPVPDPDAAQREEPGLEYYRGALSKLEALVPEAIDLGVANAWSGVQTSTPDGHPILGETPVDGFWLACGWNGLGVMSAPTVGRALAERIADGSTDVLELDRLGLDRFDADPADRISPEQLA